MNKTLYKCHSWKSLEVKTANFFFHAIYKFLSILNLCHDPLITLPPFSSVEGCIRYMSACLFINLFVVMEGKNLMSMCCSYMLYATLLDFSMEDKTLLEKSLNNHITF